jgi:hypothetical protein
MGEGLIGLIILIVVLNVLGRILRAVTSAQKRPAGKVPARPAPPPRTREQEILRELLELEHERERAFEKGKTIEAATVPETELPEQAAGFEGGDEPKDTTAWSEEGFEKSAAETEAFAYRTAEGPVTAPGELAAAAEAPAPERMVTRRRRRAVSPTRLQCMLGDVPSLRTAVLLSVILGPCRAKRRHR